MNLSDVDIKRLLPVFMKDDKAVQAINNVLQEEIKSVARKLPLLSTWDNIDQLTEDELDELAWEINIPWYRQDYDITMKRELVRDGMAMLDLIGTPYAVEKVIEDVFGSATVEEYWEYEGEPHHFSVLVKDGDRLTGAAYQRFVAIIDKIKRKSQWLDAVFTSYNAVLGVYKRAIVRETITQTLTA